MTNKNPFNLFVTVETEYESDAGELDALTRRLRRELLETDVTGVQQADGGELPQGAKAAGAIDWNTLLVTLAGSGGMLVTLVGTLTAWLQRNRGTKMHVRMPDGTEMTLEGAEVDQATINSLVAVMEAKLKASVSQG